MATNHADYQPPLPNLTPVLVQPIMPSADPPPDPMVNCELVLTHSQECHIDPFVVVQWMKRTS